MDYNTQCFEESTVTIQDTFEGANVGSPREVTRCKLYNPYYARNLYLNTAEKNTWLELNKEKMEQLNTTVALTKDDFEPTNLATW